MPDSAPRSAQMPLGLDDTRPRQVALSPGATLLRGFASDQAEALLHTLTPLLRAAPFRHMITPGGRRMSVTMTSCGAWGWMSDQAGYRYTSTDPATHAPWPAMPPLLHHLTCRSAATAGFEGFTPNSCLINRYEAGTRMALHQDKDEGDTTHPIVSVSLGLPIFFLWGGLQRSDQPRPVLLEHGDILVWGGKARLHYHGVKPLRPGLHPLTGPVRLNLTFRYVAKD
ncbi:DNA oxidative demethylase AlkB [Acetobacter farinalis]|uniref:DNA oxidative demethylase AlkB n=1 Tax=Acetobacter farinalis TaxID=1260984 RepID=A0ABT3Q9C8_9PROT|nr:DNA oxidative demethylase AlkB [Acetobacter farinalis]MCX2561870.1 DNA oxidative demethylase AlkB [Acetobacter farinalis]